MEITEMIFKLNIEMTHVYCVYRIVYFKKKIYTLNVLK